MKRMQNELLSPKTDFVFKALFGDERNKDILVSLLNAVWQHSEGKEIADVQVLNPNMPKDWWLQKDAVLDLRARDTDGRLFHIEIQCQDHKMLVERILYYWSRLYGNQLKEKDDYGRLHPVISIVFVDFVMFPDLPKWHSCWQWREEGGMVLTNHAEIHIVEMPKFTGRATKKETALGRWVKFLREGEQMTTQAIQRLQDERIQQAYEELERLSRDPDMRMYYEERLKGIKDYLSAMAEHYSKGKEEMARNMWALGLPETQIAQCAGVSVQELRTWLNIGEPQSTESSVKPSKEGKSKKRKSHT